MKKVVLYISLLALTASCSGHTETATESTTSSLPPTRDSISEWVDGIQDKKEILEAMNVIKVSSDGSALAGLCDDPDVNKALKKRNYQPVVITGQDDGTQDALEILHDIPNHGSKFVPPHLDQIETMAQQRGDLPKVEPFGWLDDDKATLDKTLKDVGFDPEAEDATEKFVELVTGKDCEKVLPRYCKYVDNARSTQMEALKSSAKLDVLLACDLTLWASELRLNYPKNDYRLDRFRKYMSDDAIVSVRKQVFVGELAKRGVKRAFEEITPRDPQYMMLRNARKIYLDAIENGGWPEVKAPAKFVDPVIGKSYDYVPALRQRLKAEGYGITDTETNVFDQQLSDAIATYRDVHQLNDKKVVDSVLFKNMAVPPQDRLDTIDLALQKYREAAVGSLEYYVLVNIPDFHVEVWKDGKRLLRNRIVVGNDKVEKDPATGKLVPEPETLYPLHPNRTPIQTSKINEVILNPYWNVPPRIRQQELEPKLAENPNYYIENNYEEVNVDNPKLYYVREKPNPKNSLGQVKFMFPNPHNTYLHDTPVKAVFKNPIRALSHGCMRVQNPLDLAKLILTNDGQYNERDFNAILHADPLEEVTIKLNRPVDVDVIYINARVDDSGVVAFLSDIYQYDAVRTGKVVLKKLPKPADWK